MFALLHVLLLLSALGGGTPFAPVRGAQREPRPVAELRERLRAAPAPERERLERHLAEFEELTPAARRKLLERARTLRERERTLGRPQRPAEPRVAGAEARLRDEFRAQGSEVRKRLPEGLRKRLERAKPEQRRRLLERLAQERERFSRTAIDAMRERLRLSPLEVWRLERMPVDQRLDAMRELAGASRGRPRR